MVLLGCKQLQTDRAGGNHVGNHNCHKHTHKCFSSFDISPCCCRSEYYSIIAKERKRSKGWVRATDWGSCTEEDIHINVNKLTEHKIIHIQVTPLHAWLFFFPFFNKSWINTHTHTKPQTYTHTNTNVHLYFRCILPWFSSGSGKFVFG